MSGAPERARPSRRTWIAAGAALTGGLALSGLLRWLPRTGRRLALTPVVRAVLEDPGSPRTGPTHPQVTVVLFSDYLCPICKVTDPALLRRIAVDPTVAVIWKDWPIRGPVSEAAARAALAADRQGLYLPVHRALMEAKGPLDAARIADLAAGVGADPARLAKDLAARRSEIEEQLGRHAAQAFSLGLQGTPAYLVGPYLIEGGLDDRRLGHAIEAARRAGPPA